MVIITYLFSLTLCVVIVSKPLIKNFDAIELSGVFDNNAEEMDDLNEDNDTENNTEIQDFYLCSSNHLLQYPVLSADKIFPDKEIGFLSNYSTISSPPPKS